VCYLVIIARENVVLPSSKCSQEEVSSVKRESTQVTAGIASIRKLERLGKLRQQLKEGAAGQLGGQGTVSEQTGEWLGAPNLPD
jgi:hypothetical protein